MVGLKNPAPEPGVNWRLNLLRSLGTSIYALLDLTFLFLLMWGIICYFAFLQCLTPCFRL